jgi:NADPH:quinone reductase-like Zn-dependent oxidoreductase
VERWKRPSSPQKGRDWQVQDVPIQHSDHNQVLIKVRGSGLSFTDVEQTRSELSGRCTRDFGRLAPRVMAFGSHRGERTGCRWPMMLP